jgi:hypothetical protein
MVLPGSYQVRLTVADQSVIQPLELEPDPRISASHADLEAQYDFLREILHELSSTNQTLNQIGELLRQLPDWRERAPGAGALHNQIDAAERELRAIRGQLIDVNIRGAQLYPSGLHEKLSAIFDSVDSADYAPPRQAHDAFATFADQLEGLTARFHSVLREHVPGINQAIRQAGVATVGLVERS